MTGEYNCITSELRRLAVHGEQKPEVLVKLISRKEVCELLGIKLRAIKSGKFSFHKRLCVCSARYLLSETLAYIEALPIEGNSENTSE